MASEKILEKKKAFVAELAEKLKGSCVGVVVAFKGINAVDDTELRAKIRKSNSEYFVVKNTLLSRAVKLAGLGDLAESLKGSTAIAISKDDYSSAAKVLSEFSEKNDFFKLKAGFVEGKVVSQSEVEALAKLPSKEILVAMVLRALNSPISGLATVLQGTIRSLAIVLNAIKDKQAA